MSYDLGEYADEIFRRHELKEKIEFYLNPKKSAVGWIAENSNIKVRHITDSSAGPSIFISDKSEGDSVMIRTSEDGFQFSYLGRTAAHELEQGTTGIAVEVREEEAQTPDELTSLVDILMPSPKISKA